MLKSIRYDANQVRRDWFNIARTDRHMPQRHKGEKLFYASYVFGYHHTTYLFVRLADMRYRINRLGYAPYSQGRITFK